jgi:hypothetical protein
MTDIITAFEQGKYSTRPISEVSTAPPYAAIVFWVLLGIGFIVMAPLGAPSLAEACSIAICGP